MGLENRHVDRTTRRKVLDEWKDAAQATLEGAGERRQKKMLRREARREALANIEAAAKATGKFDDVLTIWDKLERNEEKRIASHESIRTEELLDWEVTDRDVIIPPPIKHVWWRQQLAGSFLDTIYDCLYELHELTSSPPIYSLTEDLNEKRKEILFYWAIRQWSPQRIAAIRKQCDRNIRKVYNKMIDDMRYELFYFLYWRYKMCLTITTTQRKFVITGIVENYADEKEVAWELNDEDMIYGNENTQYELFYFLYWRYKKRLPITTTQKAFVIAGIEKYADKTEVKWELNADDMLDGYNPK